MQNLLAFWLVQSSISDWEPIFGYPGSEVARAGVEKTSTALYQPCQLIS